MLNNKQMAQQKLYTEEQVMQAMILAATNGASYNGVLNHLTPIELPSDEEIDTIAKDRINLSNDCFGEYTFTSGKQDGFYEGAKWLRDKILNQ